MKSYFTKGFTPHFLRRQKGSIALTSKNGAGFTVVELMISASIIIVILSFVLANFRSGGYSGQLDSIMSQIVNAVSTVRNKTLAGEIMANPSPPPDQIFPEGGYEIYFQVLPDSSVSYTLKAVLQSGTEIDLPNSSKTFLEIEFFNPDNPAQIGFLATTFENEAGGFYQTCYIGDWLKIIFSESGGVAVDYPTACNQPGEIKYVGGIFRHKQTSQTAYFYVSLLSGLVSGSLIYAE